MKKVVLFICCSFLLVSCQDSKSKKSFTEITKEYWEERMQMFPLEATASGDIRYNDKMTITISVSFRDSLKNFYQRYWDELSLVDTNKLNNDERISYRLLKYEMLMNIQGMKFPTHYIPVAQFWSPVNEFAQLGSGTGNQPFKTVKDYDNFLKRMAIFPNWVDTAIFNMRKGIAVGWVLPKPLTMKVLPQLQAMVTDDATKSIFYSPVKNMPASFSQSDKDRLTKAYTTAIEKEIVPAYKKLHEFFSTEYLANSRTTTGVGDIPLGEDYYDYCIEYFTTTKMKADSIYAIGLKEVDRIQAEMNKVKDQVGFKGDLKAFFEYLNTDKQFFPFTTEQQVLDSFWAIKKQEDPQLKKLFNHVPKSTFTIRQTEAFRAASASAEYNQPSEDGTRPGIFYVPILDPKKFNAVGMVTLFLHEAIPGHHYQISMQQENKNLPKFRRFLWYSAYGEGWALYTETLGKEMGLYDGNPYQYFGHLSDAMHRAIRLVVDVGMHRKGMTREAAIQYMMEHERITEEEATAEIERYMSIPGQALSYKIGQLTISTERKKYEQQLGAKFNIAAFHDEVLKYGCVPLSILQEKLKEWADHVQ